MAISFALRACLLASAAAGMTACATNPPLLAAAIDYRGDDPARPLTREAQRPTVLADKSRPSAAAASTAPPARVAPRPMPGAPRPAVTLPSLFVRLIARNEGKRLLAGIFG